MTRIDFALTPAQRADAREALRLLDGSSLTLTEAARRALQGRRALRRINVATGINEFVRTRLSLRPATADWYERKLKPLGEGLGARMMDDVDVPTFREWVTKFGAAKQRALTRAARAFFRWGMAQEPQIVSADPTRGLETNSQGNSGDAEFFTVAEVERILVGAGEYRAALALMFFAGVRPEEVAGPDKPALLWRHVRVDEKMIRIPADIAKSGKPRIVEGIPETVWKWLRPGRDEDRICPARVRQAIVRAQGTISREWPHDGIRHTFCTYALALTNDAGKVSHWSGHEGNPRMLHTHYRGLATRAEAEKFFALRPVTSA